jgi:DNA repair exonuclease SbcCD ATPase subunit
MQLSMIVVALALSAGFVKAENTTPIEKVMAMISGLQAKIIGEGKDAQKVYDEFAEFCEDRSRELGFEIKTGKQEVKDLSATVAKEKATAESLNAKIEELSGDIATDEKDLKAATGIREKEQGVFAAKEKELMESLDTLMRAVGILEKELSKSGAASMMQLKGAADVAKSLAVILQGTSISTADSSKLAALLQASDSDSDEDEDTGAPAAAAYKGKSGGIVETMQDLHDKAETQLEESRKEETKSIQAYEMLAQSLKDEIKFATKELDAAKKDLAASAESQASAEGDLEVTEKDLAEDIKSLATMHKDCMTGAEDFESETKSRGEELKALATAKKSHRGSDSWCRRTVVWILAGIFSAGVKWQLPGRPFRARPRPQAAFHGARAVGYPHGSSHEGRQPRSVC